VTLDEFMQQKALERGYEKTPLRKIYNTSEGSEEVDPSRTEDYLTTINPAYAKRVLDEGDGYSNSVLQNVEQQLKNEYYADPSNFIQTRETPYNQGVNTFNEGNPDQKRILDQINSGQLKIVPVSYEVTVNTDSGSELRTGYELKDARTGQTIQQQVIPIDPSKGIFNVVADDKNSSGFFNNYVSTDPKGFVNPVVSREQSQYASRKNSSADFYRNSLLASLSMTGLAFPGLGEAIGAATELGTVGGNVALNTGINAIKQGVSGQFNPLGLATSAALSYGMQGGFDGADPLTADDMYTGQAMQNLSNQAAVNMDMDWQVPPEYETEPQTGLDFGQPNDIAGAQELARQRQFEDAISQTQDIEDYERGATSGEVPKGTGPLGNVYEPSPTMSLVNLLKMTTSAIPKATVSKLPSAINTGLNTAQNMQQQSNLANMLRGTQMAQTALPSIYKQANPFNFGQQNQPVQDVSELAKLLRTA